MVGQEKYKFMIVWKLCHVKGIHVAFVWKAFLSVLPIFEVTKCDSLLSQPSAVLTHPVHMLDAAASVCNIAFLHSTDRGCQATHVDWERQLISDMFSTREMKTKENHS